MPRPGNPLNMLGVFNPLDYGGVGDGVTDDSVPLFLAVYAASRQPGGGTVLIDVPYYVGSRNIVVPGTVGCWYVGTGAVTTGGGGAWSGNIANAAVSQIGNGGGIVAVNADGGVTASRGGAAQAVVPSGLPQGLYSRVATGNGGQTMRPLCADPNVAGRIWGVGSTFGQIGYSDDQGGTFVAVAGTPAVTNGFQQMTFSASFCWLVNGNAGVSQAGQVWRSPLPAANGSGLSFTKVFDLATFPGGVNSAFRNSNLAVAEPNAYLVEYGTTVTGGPSCYVSANANTATPGNVTWTKVQTWAAGKHAHAVEVISGVPWVTIGDATTAFSDIGLWCATTAAATTWGKRSAYLEENNGNTLYGINMVAMPIAGQNMIVMESDGIKNLGPLVYPSQSISSGLAILPTCQLAFPYNGTMRGLTLTPEGTLMWVHTGEAGAVGPLDSVCIARPPFNAPIILESIPSGPQTFGTIGDPVIAGNYCFFGTWKIRREVLV